MRAPIRPTCVVRAVSVPLRVLGLQQFHLLVPLVQLVTEVLAPGAQRHHTFGYRGVFWCGCIQVKCPSRHARGSGTRTHRPSCTANARRLLCLE
eukprot:1181285-Prorocentrum_minimum.AAC.4